MAETVRSVRGADLREVLARWDREEGETRTWVHAATLGGPIIASLGILAAIVVLQGWEKAAAYVSCAGAFTFVIGKPIVLGGATDMSPLGPYELAALVAYLDVVSGVIVLFNAPLLHRLPWIGRWLRSMERASWALLRGRRWVLRATFLTLVLFVAMPIIGTGAIGGALLARIMGLRRGTTLGGIAIGTALWSFPVAVLADYARGRIRSVLESPVLGVLSVAGVIAVFLVVSLWLRHASRKALEAEGNRPGAE